MDEMVFLRERAELFADGLISVPDAAKFLSISKSKLYLVMDAGELPYVKIGSSRRIPKRALVVFVEQRLKGGWAL